MKGIRVVVLCAISIAAVSTDQIAWAIEAGYRIYQQQVPQGSPAPTDLSVDSGWTLVNPSDYGECAIGGWTCDDDGDCTEGGDPRDKCAVPIGTVAEFTVDCSGEVDLYIAYSMVFDGAVESTTLSAPSGPLSCLECEGGDSDSDGFCAAGATSSGPPADCNDSDASVYPGAPQLCDGVNNDCTNLNWPSLTGTNEADVDTDGFSTCAGDCDDRSSTVFPAAPQLCDGQNNDCNDPSWPTAPMLEVDEDGDGVLPCQSGSGVTLVQPIAVEGGSGADSGDGEAAVSNGDAIPFGAYIAAPVPVNNPANTSHDGGADIATDGTAWIAAWYETIVNDPRIMVSRSLDAGESWSAAAVVSDDAWGFINGPHIATDSHGTWGVVWTAAPTYPSRPRPLFARSTNAGVSWSSPVALDPTSTSNSYSPGLSSDKAAGWVAAWKSEQHIWATRSGDGTLTWTPPRQLTTTSASGFLHPVDVAMSTNGTAIIAWSCNGCLADPAMHYSRAFVGECSSTARNCRLDADCPQGETCNLSGGVSCASAPPETPCCPGLTDGTYCWLPVASYPFTGSPGEWDYYPSLATNHKGVWLVAWWNHTGPRPGGRGSILVSRSFDDGVSWGVPVPIVVQDDQDSGSLPHIATDGRGRWLVVWDSTTDPNGNKTEWGVYVSQSTDDGLTWTAPAALNADAEPDSIDDYYPRIATDEANNWLAIWTTQEYALDGDLLSARIFPSSIDLIEPIGPEMFQGPGITQDVASLVASHDLRWGLAADGVTRLLVRWPVGGPGTVSFSLADENGQTVGVGGLSTLGGSENLTTLPVQVVAAPNGSHYAFAVLRAPIDFVRPGNLSDPGEAQRTTRLTATFSPGAVEQTRDIVLVRPPISLVHGLWGSPESSWGSQNSPWSLKSDSRFFVDFVTYEDTHSRAFSDNVPLVGEGIRGTRSKQRARGVASTQVDVIAHSMGGILSRMYASDWSSEYLRDSNYLEGDINRLLTVDTPHYGSQLANMLLCVVNLPVIGSIIEEAVNDAVGPVREGAIHDLRINSPAILEMPASATPVHVVIGVGGEQATAEVDTIGRAIWGVLGLFGFTFQILFDGDEHDVIVAKASQLGGLSESSGTTSRYDWLDAARPAVHHSVAKEERIGLDVIALVNSPVSEASLFASGLEGGPPATPLVVPPGCGGGALLADRLVISEPTAGGSVAAGSTLVVTVVPPAGYSPDALTISSNIGTTYLTGAPFTTSLEVPNDYLGPVTIHAMAKDGANVFAFADAVTVSAITDATLQGIDVTNSPVFLTANKPTRKILVVGHFDDGVDRDVSGSAFGTTFESQKPHIVVVDAEGVVTAKQVGSVLVNIENDGWTTQARVVASSMALVLSMAQKDSVHWPPQPDVIGYDIVRGRLDVLQSSGFTASTTACLANDVSVTSVSDSELPSAGVGFWYLLRAVYSSSGHVGSYDLPSTGTGRDDGIGASPHACP